MPNGAGTMLKNHDVRPRVTSNDLESLILDDEIVSRMKRYKRCPSIRALRARFSKFTANDVEAAVLRLLKTGKVSVTDGTLWLRKRA